MATETSYSLLVEGVGSGGGGGVGVGSGGGRGVGYLYRVTHLNIIYAVYHQNNRY